jgi:hypothetical protein
MACESLPPETAATTVRPRSGPHSSVRVRLTIVIRLGGCERGIAASGDLELFAKLEGIDALEIDRKVRLGGVAIAAAGGFGREVGAAFAAEAQPELSGLLTQLLIDAAGAH